MDGGLRELLSEIQKDRVRLKSVEETLSQRPDDSSLNKLRDDLLEVINLKLNLYKVKQAKLQKDAPAPPSQQSSDDSKHSQASLSAAQSQLAAASADGNWPPKVGQRVMAIWQDNQFYIAQVVADAANGESFTVKYLEYGNSWTVALQQTYPFNSFPNKSDILAGLSVRSITKADGLIHDAVVLRAPVGDTCLLFFPHLNAQEEVSVSDIFSVLANAVFAASSAAASISGVKRSYADVSAAATSMLDKPTLPEHLRIQPTDSEAERLAKKKKIKNIKNQHKEVKQEIERSVKQSEWLSFKSTVSSKKKPGFLSGAVKKESIFKSPDSIDGRVGVTGSGKPMTSYQTLGRIDKKLNPSSSATPAAELEVADKQ